MPPVRLNLRDLPRAPAGAGGDNGAGRVSRSSAAAVAAAAGAGSPLTGSWPTWPLLALNAVQSTLKGYFNRLDALLLGLPRGLGPAVSTLVSEGARCLD